MVVDDTSLKRIVKDSFKETLIYSIVRVIIGPMIGFAFVKFFNLSGVEAGVMFIQASMQTRSGFSSGMRGLQDYSITPLETLSVLSNTQVLFAHFFGLIFSLWLLQRIYRKN